MDPIKKLKKNNEDNDTADIADKGEDAQQQQSSELVDREKLVPEYKQLIEYKNNLVKLDTLI